jgi:hypothetical protein
VIHDETSTASPPLPDDAAAQMAGAPAVFVPDELSRSELEQIMIDAISQGAFVTDIPIMGDVPMWLTALCVGCLCSAFYLAVLW